MFNNNKNLRVNPKLPNQLPLLLRTRLCTRLLLTPWLNSSNPIPFRFWIPPSLECKRDNRCWRRRHKRTPCKVVQDLHHHRHLQHHGPKPFLPSTRCHPRKISIRKEQLLGWIPRPIPPRRPLRLPTTTTTTPFPLRFNQHPGIVNSPRLMTSQPLWVVWAATTAP